MFLQLRKEEIKKLVKPLENGPIDAQIVLTDGDNIYCKMLEYSNGNIKATYLGALLSSSTIIIPSWRIAGINLIKISRSEDGVRIPARLLSDDLLTRAKKLSLQVNSIGITSHRARIDPHKRYVQYKPRGVLYYRPITLKGMAIKRGTPLYCDWRYLYTISGGLDSFGVGVPILSISAGWDSSLWSEYGKKLAKVNSFESIENLSEATISGYLKFVYRIKKDGLEKIVDYLSMEGERWIPAYLFKDNLPEDDNTTKWHLIYFKESQLMVPKELLENTIQPITVFGEIVPATTLCERGEKNFFIKARCAKY